MWRNYRLSILIGALLLALAIWAALHSRHTPTLEEQRKAQDGGRR